MVIGSTELTDGTDGGDEGARESSTSRETMTFLLDEHCKTLWIFFSTPLLLFFLLVLKVAQL